MGGLHIQGGTIHQNLTHSDTRFAVAPFIPFPFHPKKTTNRKWQCFLLPHIITKSTQSVLPFSTSHTTHKIREVLTSLSSLQNRTSVYFNYGESLPDTWLVGWVTITTVLWVQEIYVTPCTFTVSHLWLMNEFNIKTLFCVLKGVMGHFPNCKEIPCQTY